MINTLKQFFSYLKNPFPIETDERINLKSLLSIFYLFLISYGLKVFWLLTVNKYLRSKYDISRSEIAKTEEQSIWLFFLLAVIVYPIVEEFIFRYYLKNKKILFLIILSIILAITGYWLTKNFAYPNLIIKRIVLSLSAMLPVLTIIVFYLKQKKLNTVNEIYEKYYFIPFYISVISFALLHGFNFDFSESNLLIIPLIVPFIFSGLTLGYARVKYGMWANLLIHIGFNLTTFILDKGFGI